MAAAYHGMSLIPFWTSYPPFGRCPRNRIKLTADATARSGSGTQGRAIDGLQNVGVHVLRHTFCSHLAMLGGPTCAIQELAGHRDLITTQRYMHLSPAAAEGAIRLSDRRTPPPHDGDIVETAGAVLKKERNDGRKLVAGARNQRYLQLWSGAA